MVDDLSTPLGQNRPKRPPHELPIVIPQTVAGVAALGILVFAGWAMLADDPYGGEPMAVALADLRPDTPKKATDAPAPAATASRTENRDRNDGPKPGDGPPAATAAPAVPPGAKTVTLIDGSTGKRQDVVIPGNAAATPSPTAPGGTNAVDPKPPADPRLTETSRHGPLPRVAEDGTRPSDAFAHAVKPLPGKPDAPRIAIVMGGLGVGSADTNNALVKLPAAVTFAFPPYSSGLDAVVERARDHEMLLQVPMEPVDYPDNDPGPQTLLTSLDAAQNVDRLQWQMSRFQGYVGLTNYMGARFTASEQALTPVLRESAKRGLLYFDDGSSPRSAASQIAGGNNLPFAKADVVLDASPIGADVDRALARLEGLARQRGIAVGMANALPVSIDRIARWAKAAESRGILLVPISAVVTKAAKPS